MSLGYVRGNMWVVDERYRKWADAEPYKLLVMAAAREGVTWKLEYSYSARRYTAEIQTIERVGATPCIVPHNNAFDDHPMTALIRALRHYGEGRSNMLIWVLCVEIEILVLREKLLPLAKCADEIERLADTLLAARMFK